MKYKLGDVCSRLSSGKGISAKLISAAGNYPVYGGNGLRGYTECSNFTGECAIIGRQGAFCGNVRYFSGDAYMTEHAVVACANEDNDTRYLSYLLSTMQLGRLSGQSAQPGLSVKVLSQQEVDLPSLEQQQKVVGILAPIENKIQLNNSINKNLEQQAQAIFKAWFIDFEPFSNRKPSDWSVSTLGNVSIMGAGGDKPQNVSPRKTDLYEYPIYSNGLSNEGLYGFTDNPKVSEESVTVSARGTIGFVCLRHIPYVPIVRLVTLIPKTEIISAKYLYLWLKQLHITGTGTTQQQLTVPDFQKTEILVPSKEIVTLFTATVEPIFEKIWANQNENEKLSSLRDTLLPKLLSGELDVSDIDL